MAKSIHHSIPGQLSSYINEEYPLFVEFLSAYYEWLESDASPYNVINKHLSYLDFKESMDEYVSLLKQEYLASVPEKVLADKELLIRFSKQFFQSLGSQKSFQFLFKILFGEDIEIYYPKVDILRVSDGKWVDDEVLMYVSNRGNVESFLYRTIRQDREIAPGVFVSATATVNRIINRYANKFVFSEIYLTDVEGEFDINFPITSDGKIEWIMPIGGEVEVINGGVNYTQDNSITYAGDSTFHLVITVTENNAVDTKYNTLFTANELNVTKNGLPFTSFSYNGTLITSSSISVGDVIDVEFPIYSGFIVVDDTSNTLRAIESVKVIDTPFGITTPQTLQANEGGSGAVLSLKPATVRRIPGYFFNDDGFLSSSKRLQDSDYYQDFSYVIKASYDVEKYRDVVMRLLHPAGMKMIGEVNILELIKLMIRDVEYTLQIKTIGEVSDSSSSDLYSRFGFIEDWKNKFESETYKTNDFKHMVVGDVVLRPNIRMPYHDSTITIATP